MTKGKNERRHIQNRAWEKDRRDRLNNTFDKLAELLPEYRPKSVFSKIEILHKAIVYIEDLRKELRDVLCSENASMLKKQEELEESIKALVTQNNDLVELLKKANVKVPHFVSPKLLSFIITVNDDKTSSTYENVENKSNIQDIQTYQTPQNKNNGESNDETPNVHNKYLKSTNPCDSPDTRFRSKSQLNILPELTEVQSFGSVDLIPVTNSPKPELKIHEKPVKNFVEITPLLNDQFEMTSTQPEKPSTLQLKEHPKLQESKKEKVSMDISVTLNEVQLLGNQTSMIQKPNEKNSESDLVHNAEHKSKAASNVAQVATKNYDKSSEKQIVSQEKNIDSTHSKVSNNEQNKVDKMENVNNSRKKVENLELLKDPNEDISNEKNLSDELFGNFPLSHTPNESNANALSPTAAFLLSFPVVSNVSNSKQTDNETSYTEGAHLLRSDDKQNQSKDNIFESISSILNDLNDVSDSKTLPSVDSSSSVPFPYYVNKHKSNTEHEKPHALKDISVNRNKPNQKNLNITSLLNNNERIRQSHNHKNESSKTLINGSEKQQVAGCSNTVQTNNLASNRTNYMPPRTFENPSIPVENTSDFYVSLSTLGLPLKSTAPLASTSINPNSHFNFPISPLTQQRNLMDSRPPFSFSLSNYCETSSTTSNTTKVTSQQENICQLPMQGTTKRQKKSSPINDRFMVPSEPTMATLNRCNSFNPFSFDNPPILPSSPSIALSNLTTASSACSTIGTPFTFTLTPTLPSISSSNLLLSNHDPLFSSSLEMPIIRSANTFVKTPRKDKMENDHIMLSNSKHTSNHSAASATKPNTNLVNWMTSNVKNKPQMLHWDYGSSSHCGTTEEPSGWSPIRATIDNISSSALPMLQGDLALNTISSSCSHPSNKFEMHTKKASMPIANPKYGSKLPNIRKSEHNMHSDRNGKDDKNNKNPQIFKSNQRHFDQSAARATESIPITNNFHSVSQLLDQERQTVNKNHYYTPNDEKLYMKSSNSNLTKQKLKHETEVNNHGTESKYQTTIGSGDAETNEYDKDVFGGYFFGQSKRLKLNYHSTSEFLGNQSIPSTYENSTGNDILTPYANYQTFDSDCNSASTSLCINNLSNQMYSYQYTQPQSYNHQHTQQQPQNNCDLMDSTNYFQAPAHLPNFKAPNLNDVVRNNVISNIQQPPLHQTSTKSSEPITNAKCFASTTSTPASNSTSAINCSTNRNSTVKAMQCTSHMTGNNLPLNQTKSESFSWMPYTNTIDKAYNNNLFNTESSNGKMITTNSISGGNNTIPNFNLTTIFPDYNKS